METLIREGHEGMVRQALTEQPRIAQHLASKVFPVLCPGWTRLIA